MKRHFGQLLKLATEMFVIADGCFPGMLATEFVCTSVVESELESTEPFSFCSKKVVSVGERKHATVVLMDPTGGAVGRVPVPDEFVSKFGVLWDKLFEEVRRWFFIVPMKLAVCRTEGRIRTLLLEPGEVILADSGS